MRWLLVLTCSSLMGNIAAIKELDQTFINRGLLGQGIIFEIMQDSIGAIQCTKSTSKLKRTPSTFAKTPFFAFPNGPLGKKAT